ncbi:MAG: hypothetical protein ABGW69_01895 [Nanoarchaeota archaeon]
MKLELEIKAILSKDEIESNELHNILNKKEVFNLIPIEKTSYPIKIPKLIANKGVLKDKDIVFIKMVVKESEDPLKEISSIEELEKSKKTNEKVNEEIEKAKNDLIKKINPNNANNKLSEEKSELIIPIKEENKGKENKLVVSQALNNNLNVLSKEENNIEKQESKQSQKQKINNENDELIKKLRELKEKISKKEKNNERKEDLTNEFKILNKEEKKKKLSNLESLLENMLTIKTKEEKEKELKKSGIEILDKKTEKKLKKNELKNSIVNKTNKSGEKEKINKKEINEEAEEFEENIQLLLKKLREIKEKIKHEL